jgi:transposase-like protein
MSAKSELKLVEEEAPACRVCGSTDVNKEGTHVDMKNRLISQRYCCRRCGSTFTAGKGRNMKFPDYAVRLGVFLVTRKEFYSSDAAEFLNEAFGLPVKPDTVSKWVHTYRPGFKMVKGRRPGPGGRRVYYKPTRRKADARTVSGIRSLMKEVEGKLQTFEKRAERFS